MLYCLNEGRRIAFNIMEVQTNSLKLSEPVVGKVKGIIK